jgi:hypothetical protein
MPVDPSTSFYLHVAKNHHCGRLGPSSPGGVALRCVSFCFSCPAMRVLFAICQLLAAVPTETLQGGRDLALIGPSS